MELGTGAALFQDGKKQAHTLNLTLFLLQPPAQNSERPLLQKSLGEGGSGPRQAQSWEAGVETGGLFLFGQKAAAKDV